MSLAILFHFLCTQHVSDIKISIIRSLRLCCWITTLVYCSWFDLCWGFGVVGLELQAEACNTDILMSETCWAHKKWNKIASDIKLVFFSSAKRIYSLHSLFYTRWKHICYDVILFKIRFTQSVMYNELYLRYLCKYISRLLICIYFLLWFISWRH